MVHTLELTNLRDQSLLSKHFIHNAMCEPFNDVPNYSIKLFRRPCYGPYTIISYFYLQESNFVYNG